jgi:hypothetical protein
MFRLMMLALLVGGLILLCSVVSFALGNAIQIRIIVTLLHSGYAGRSFWANVVVMVVLILINTGIHLAEIALWALTFMACGEFESFERAFYHSAVNYTSLGYGDIVMSQSWRLLGPLETMDGLLLFGISAALMFAVLSRIVQQRLEKSSGRDHSQDRDITKWATNR